MKQNREPQPDRTARAGSFLCAKLTLCPVSTSVWAKSGFLWLTEHGSGTSAYSSGGTRYRRVRARATQPTLGGDQPAPPAEVTPFPATCSPGAHGTGSDLNDGPWGVGKPSPELEIFIP